MALPRILIIEDDPFLSSLLKNRLAKEGFDVLVAHDGDEGLKMLSSDHPDSVLLDIILPKKSGFEVLAEIRQDPNLEKVPVIIISNLGQPEDVRRGDELGVIGYFVKAKTSIDDLMIKIKGFLAGKQ